MLETIPKAQPRQGPVTDGLHLIQPRDINKPKFADAAIAMIWLMVVSTVTFSVILSDIGSPGGLFMVLPASFTILYIQALFVRRQWERHTTFTWCIYLTAGVGVTTTAWVRVAGAIEDAVGGMTTTLVIAVTAVALCTTVAGWVNATPAVIARRAGRGPSWTRPVIYTTYAIYIPLC